MAVYLELLTRFDIGDEYRFAIEQLKNHVRTIPSGAQLSRKDLEERIVEPDVVVNLEWSSSDVSVVEGLGLLFEDRRVLVRIVPQLL